jgi:hypothetical protein
MLDNKTTLHLDDLGLETLILIHPLCHFRAHSPIACTKRELVQIAGKGYTSLQSHGGTSVHPQSTEGRPQSLFADWQLHGFPSHPTSFTAHRRPPTTRATLIAREDKGGCCWRGRDSRALDVPMYHGWMLLDTSPLLMPPPSTSMRQLLLVEYYPLASRSEPRTLIIAHINTRRLFLHVNPSLPYPCPSVR